MGRDTLCRIALIACVLTDRPSNAPSRSTQCSHSNPASANRRAWFAGSLLKTVALAISPRFRRTHFPLFRSIAGKMITVATPKNLRAFVILQPDSFLDGIAYRKDCYVRRRP